MSKMTEGVFRFLNATYFRQKFTKTGNKLHLCLLFFVVFIVVVVVVVVVVVMMMIAMVVVTTLNSYSC
jgi:hypothetical protein